MATLNFQHPSVTWSFRNHANMLIWCWRIIYYQCWKQLCFLNCTYLKN